MEMITNPIIKGFHPDPVICNKGEDYYIATSTFEWFPGVRIFHSRNFKDWELVAQPLDRINQLDMNGVPDSGGVWAPCLTYSDGLFWLVYSNVKSVDSPWKTGDNFVVTAKNIEGPWSDPIKLKFGGFDPSLFHDESGRKYITYRQWGPRHHSNPHNNIIIQEYFHDEQRLSTDRKVIFTGTKRGLTEAPHIYKVDNFYYLILAEGGTVYEHAVTVLRSKNVHGPFELHPDETILTTIDKPDAVLQKAGHGSMIKTHSNEWYMVFLVGRPLPDTLKIENNKVSGYCPLGRETAIDKIEWRDGWPYVVGGSNTKLQIEAPSFSTESTVITNSSDVFIDNFNTDSLQLEWQTLRVPFSKKMGELIQENSTLRLYGLDPLISQFPQSTVGHRWKHFDFDAITSVSFDPKNEQQNAGIACYYNTKNWIYCFVDLDENSGERALKIIQVDHGEASYYFYDELIKIPDEVVNISFKVCVRSTTLTFLYSFDELSWQSLDVTFDAWKLSDDYVKGKGFFTGAFICLHCSDLSGEGIFADFHHFEYNPLTTSEI